MRLIMAILAAICTVAAFAAGPTISLQGRVKDAVNHYDLTHARIILTDSTGKATDTLRANMGLRVVNNQLDTMSMFFFHVPRREATIVYDVECKGYKPHTVTYELKNIGRREQSRDMGTILLERAPETLREVTVTSTKIKFYNKGDTLVYNADAFNLAEGSMLDALVAQLPGAELSNDGQIKVNGEFVESLLLNGKEFLDGDNNLMLQNIGAYTVKDIQVYEGITPEDKRRGDNTAAKVLTMDVRLKKEYNMGWLVNAQGGYGTEDRYMGRLFANWFNATTRVTLVGNVNNLNDNRQPGRTDTWTPEQMPSGRREYRMGAIDYNHQKTDESFQANGNVRVSQSVNRNEQSTDRTNFLTGGDTYERRFGNSRNRTLFVSTRHSMYANLKSWMIGATVNGTYDHHDNNSSNLEASFSKDPGDVTRQVLEAMYGQANPGLLASALNRAQTRSDGSGTTYQAAVSPYFNYRLPHSNDMLYLTLDVNYNSNRDELWRDYTVNYGADANPAVRRRQLVDNKPNHTLMLGLSTGYRMRANDFNASASYRYLFTDKVKDSYMYALDHLQDMGVYGTVPQDYLAAFDPANSYTGHTFENEHVLSINATWDHEYTNGARLMVYARPEMGLTHRRLRYERAGTVYPVSTSNFTVTLYSIWDAMIEAQFGKLQGWRRRHSIRYSYRVEPTLPNMMDMVDVVNDAEPLNIYYGNPGLRPAYAHRHLVRWSFTPTSQRLNNILYLGMTHTTDALTRGYTYNTTTGVRHNRMYNVGGNRSFAVTDELSLQFGAKKQWTLSNEIDINASRLCDMVGTDTDEPLPVRVNNRNISDRLRLSWQIGSQTLAVRCDWTNRHTTSHEAGFHTINANHVNYGVTGTFKLPAGFGASTDLTCYTRRGYGSSALDTTDPVWNLRLTYTPPRNNHWTFIADGFDMLHQLSNVSYAVTATGRTVTYTNTLPRYFLMSVQYRLSIQPRKR